MAKTIYQRIALEGGKGIADELRKIGKDGEAAFVEIRGAAAKLSKDLSSLGGAVGDLGKSLATVGKRVAIAGAAIGAAVAGTVAFAKAGTDAADAATKQAQALGLATDEYGRLAFAAEQSGVDAGTFATAITRFNQEIGKAADGNKAAVKRFQELGLSIKDASGAIRPTEELIAELANRFATLPDGAEKSALATELFGRAGARLLPLLNGGAAGIRNLGEEATRLGIVFTREQAVIAEGMNDALAALNRGIEGTRFQLGLLFAPSITEAARAFQKVIEDNRQAITDYVRNGVEKAEPIIRDLVNAIVGNDADVRNIWVLKAKLEILRFAYDVENAFKQIIIPAYELLKAAGQQVADAINAIFGTQFTGQQIIVAAIIGKLLGLFSVLGAALGVVGAAARTVASIFGFFATALTNPTASMRLLGVILRGVGTALLSLVSLPGLVITALAGLAIVIYRNWDAIKEGGRAAWEFIKGIWNAAPQFFGNLFANVGRVVGDLFASIASLIGTVWTGIAEGAALAVEAVRAGFAGVGEFLNATFITAANAVAEALQGIATTAAAIWVDVRDTATAAIAGLAQAARDLWAGIATAAEDQLAGLVAVFDRISDRLAEVWAKIRSGAAGVFSFLRDGFEGVVDSIGGLFDGLATRISNAWDRIKSIVSSAKSALSSIGSGSSGGSSSGDSGILRPFATGGYVSGPGTGTSDSIMARLSNGEFVIRAAAVRKYGPQLLDAINKMRLPRLPQFATGGLVSAPRMPRVNLSGIVDSLTQGMAYQAPRFADGGMVAIPAQAQGRPISLTIDGRTFEGLTAPEQVAEDLTRFATNRRMRSAGRKPGWVGA